MKKTIRLYKALPITRNEKVTPVTIYIHAEVPPIHTLEDAESQYQSDASLLAETLFKVLPQGTCDRLLIALMQHKVSLYRGTTNS